MLSTLSFYCFLSAAILSLLIALVYSFRKKIMPYHEEALETDWDQIDAKYQFMFKAMLNGGGFFGISSAVMMLVLLFIPFQNGELWAGFTIGIAGLIGALPLTWIVYNVKTKTAGNPPLWLIILIDVLLILGLLFLHF